MDCPDEMLRNDYQPAAGIRGRCRLKAAYTITSRDGQAYRELGRVSGTSS